MFSNTFIHQHTFTGMAFSLKETWPLRIRCIVPSDIGVSKNSCKSSSLKCTWQRTSFSLNLTERAFPIPASNHPSAIIIDSFEVKKSKNRYLRGVRMTSK